MHYPKLHDLFYAKEWRKAYILLGVGVQQVLAEVRQRALLLGQVRHLREALHRHELFGRRTFGTGIR